MKRLMDGGREFVLGDDGKLRRVSNKPVDNKALLPTVWATLDGEGRLEPSPFMVELWQHRTVRRLNEQLRAEHRQVA